MSSDNATGHRVFTTAEIAGYCGVTTDGVLKWIRSGKLGAFSTPGGRYRIGAPQLRAFLRRFDMPVDEAFLHRRPRERSVLVLGDEKVVRWAVRRLVEELDGDLEVVEAPDGYAAGIKIGARPPRLVILDLSTSGVDGVGLCRSIRDNPATASIKILTLARYSEEEKLERAHEAGADLCLMKPLQFEHLRLVVTRLLGLVGAQQERAIANR